MLYTLNEHVHKKYLNGSAIKGAPMPKLIENVRTRALEAAKNELLVSDYNGFTIRSVAKRCGIAVGTLYNYFPSKDMLAAAVMLQDWTKALAVMRQSATRSQNILDGLQTIYEEIERFASVYRNVWSQYSLTSQFASDYSDRHQLLLNQLAAIIHDLLANFQADEDQVLDRFVAENLLMAAVNQTPYQPLAVLLNRLFIIKKR